MTFTPEQIEADLSARWLPTDIATARAVALLAAVPEADLALIPLTQPGKERNWWQVGQVVQTVPGTIVLAVNADDGRDELDPYHVARARVYAIAREVLGHRDGTVALAAVWPDGHVAVFEDFRTR